MRNSAESMGAVAEGEASSRAHRAAILYVIGSLQVGGAERHLTMVAGQLVARGWKVAVYSLTTGGPLRDSLERVGVTVIHPPRHLGSVYIGNSRVLRRIAGVAHLFKVMLTGNFGIVHLFLPHAYLVGAPLAFFSRIPVRIMSRRSLNLYQTERWFLRPLEKLLHRTMSAIVANSVMVWRELREQEAVPDKRLAIIYSGVDTERFASGEDAREQLRKSLAVSESDLVITSVANLIPYKGHHDLIRAIAHAAPNLSRQWKLLIVGRDDGIGAELKQMVHGYALTEHVVFLGARDDVPDILAASDIGVLPSHQEGFPNAALEVMAAGLPMIVTDVGGAAEAVQHNVTGFVVERGDPEALSAAILRLVHDHELRSRFGHAGQRQIAAQFSLDRCVSDYELLYSNLIARSGIPQRLRARNVLAARTPGPDDQGRSNCDTILDMGYSSTCLSGGSRS